MPKTWNDEQLRAAVAESRNISQTLRALGLRPVGGNYETIRLRIVQLGLDTRHWLRRGRVTASESQLREAVANSTTMSETITALGWPLTSGSRGRLNQMLALYQVDTGHFRRGSKGSGLNRVPIQDVLGRATVQSNWLKRRLIDEGLLFPLCEFCGCDEWMGNPIPLELDHINGDRSDNRLENLRVLCPNCHALTPTYRGRNIGKRRTMTA